MEKVHKEILGLMGKIDIDCRDEKDAIIINIGLPIGLIFARAGKFKDLETGLNALFQTGKRTSDNKMLRFMKHYIFGNREEMLHVLRSEKQIQGLMQIYQDFCAQNQNNCLHCPFPDVVK